MGVHSVRVSDLPAVHRLGRTAGAALVRTEVPGTYPSPTMMALRSGWRSLGYRNETFVFNDGTAAHGFVQARARDGNDAWDVVRLSVVASSEPEWERATANLLDTVSTVAARRGTARTFLRVIADSPCIGQLADIGYRPFATEITHRGLLHRLAVSAPAAGADIRARHPRDAWDIFSLYCAVTPALVRHAEGRSLREWANVRQHRMARNPASRKIREVVLVGEGGIAGWLHWEPMRGRFPQLLDLLIRPEYAHRIPEMVRYAVDHLDLQTDRVTLCKCREYDGKISVTLEEAGLDAILRETLLVRHTLARVTERQAPVTALRTNGLGIDISHYRQGTEAAHQRMAAGRRIEHQHHDQYERADRASCY